MLPPPPPPFTGKIPERINSSTLVFFSFPTNCLVVPSLSALFVPTYTNIHPPWPCSSVLFPFSRMLYPSPRKTNTSPLLNVLSVFRKMESSTNTLSFLNAPSSTASGKRFHFASTWSLTFPLPLCFFPASFLPTITHVINFPFITSTFTSFLLFIFLPIACSSLLSCPIVIP